MSENKKRKQKLLKKIWKGDGGGINTEIQYLECVQFDIKVKNYCT
jgi:hypothetical protein